MQCSAKKNKQEQQPFHYKNVRVKCKLNQPDAEQTDTSKRANPIMSCSPAKCGTVSLSALKWLSNAVVPSSYQSLQSPATGGRFSIKAEDCERLKVGLKNDIEKCYVEYIVSALADVHHLIYFGLEIYHLNIKKISSIVVQVITFLWSNHSVALWPSVNQRWSLEFHPLHIHSSYTCVLRDVTWLQANR